MTNKIQIRRDTAANWTLANPTLALGEPALETDTGRQKVGDGINAWASLVYGPVLPGVGPGPLGPIGGPNQIPQITIDAAGRITALTTVSSSSQPLTPTAVQANTYQAAAFDFVIADTSSSAFTVTLPASPVDGTVIAVKLIIQATPAIHPLTIATGNSFTFNKISGPTTLTLTLVNQGVLLQFNSLAGVWYVLSDDLPLAALDSRYAAYGSGGGGGGTGTVTSISVATANGLAGSVTNPTTTPTINLATSVTGMLKGGSFAISAATAGTDYSAGTSALTTGILKSTTTTGALTIAVAADFPTLNQNTTGTAAGLSANIAESQVTNLTTDLAAKAPLVSPALTGTPTVPTATALTNSITAASTAYADTAVAVETTARVTSVTSRSLIPTSIKTATTYTAVAGDFVMVDATSNAITITAPALVAGVRWGVRLTTAVTNAVTLTTGTGTFDTNGTNTLVMASGTGTAFVDVTFAANAAGTQWVGTTSGKPNAYLGTLFAAINATAGGDLTGNYPNPTLNATANVQSTVHALTTQDIPDRAGISGASALSQGVLNNGSRQPIFDLVMGDSISYGTGSSPGWTDWGTVLSRMENRQLGLPDPGPGLLVPTGGGSRSQGWSTLNQGASVANKVITSVGLTSGNPVVTATNFTGLVPGMGVTYTTTFSATATNGTNTLTFGGGVTGISNGQTVTGAGIVSATVASIAGNVVTLSGTFSGSLTTSNYVFKGITIPNSVYVASISGGNLTLGGGVPTTTCTATLTFDATPIQGLTVTNTAWQLSATGQVAADGLTTSGTAISIANVTSNAANATVTASSFPNVIGGMSVTGPGIQPNTFVKNVNSGTSITLSKTVSLTSTTSTLVFGRFFHRAIIFYQKVNNGDDVIFNVAGALSTSTSTHSTVGGIGIYDSGSLGYKGINGVTVTQQATATQGIGGGGVNILGVRYIISPTGGQVTDNLGQPSYFAFVFAGVQQNGFYTGWAAMAKAMAQNGTPYRRLYFCAGTNDWALSATPAQIASSFGTVAQILAAVSPTTEMVMVGQHLCDGVGTYGNVSTISGSPLVASTAFAGVLFGFPSLVTGNLFFGNGIGPGASVTTVAGTTNNSNSTIASVTTTTASATATVTGGGFPNVLAGMLVSGTGIPAGVYVGSISTNTMTFTGNFAGITGGTQNLTFVVGVTSVTTTTSSATATVGSGGFPNVVPGMIVSGTGIPLSIYVVSVSGNTLTLGGQTGGITGGTPTLTFTAAPWTVASVNTGTGSSSASAAAFPNIAVGMLVQGLPGNPAGVYVGTVAGGSMTFTGNFAGITGVGPSTLSFIPVATLSVNSTATGTVTGYQSYTRGSPALWTQLMSLLSSTALANNSAFINMYEHLGDLSQRAIAIGVTCTNGSTSLTVTSGGFPGVVVGHSLNGNTGFPLDTTVTAVNGNTLTISAPFNGTTTTAATLLFYADTWGISNGGVHPGDYSQSLSGRDGERAYAETIFNKLSFAKAMPPLPYSFQTNDPTDGAIVGTLPFNSQSLGVGWAGYANTTDAQPMWSLQAGFFIAPSIWFGTGGNSAVDTSVGRAGTGIIGIGNALQLHGLTGATTINRWVGATTGGFPSSGTFNLGDWVTTSLGQNFSYVSIFTANATLGTINQTPSVLTVASTANCPIPGGPGLASTLTVLVNQAGSIYTVSYTGVTTSTLTGCTIASGTLTIGAVAGTQDVAYSPPFWQKANESNVVINNNTFFGLIAPNVDLYDTYTANALGFAITVTYSGTPSDGQFLTLRMTDNGTPRAITWGSPAGTQFEPSGTITTLPTTTVTSTMLTCQFQYNAVTSKWRICWKS